MYFGEAISEYETFDKNNVSNSKVAQIPYSLWNLGNLCQATAWLLHNETDITKLGKLTNFYVLIILEVGFIFFI